MKIIFIPLILLVFTLVQNISGTCSFYQPTLQEMILQNNLLAEYNPGTLVATSAFRAAPPDDDCIRWQHVSARFFLKPAISNAKDSLMHFS